MNTRYFLFFVILSLSFKTAYCQDSSLLARLNDSLAGNSQVSFVSGTFKGLHVINMQTVEAPARGALNFIIMHRFGKLNDGAYNFFGLDNASIRLGLDYGITDRLAVGVGRSSLEKTFDAYAKFKLLRQTDRSGKVPVSVSLLEIVDNYTLKIPDKPYLNAKYRTVFTSQLLIARKFDKNFSLQLTPSWQHFNLVPSAEDKNDLFIIGIGGRMKFTKRMSINAEYNYLPSGQLSSFSVDNSLSLGVDMETGGHVFQLIFSNSQGMTESQYLARTVGRWDKGDIYFGFNISRNFNISSHAKQRKTPGY